MNLITCLLSLIAPTLAFMSICIAFPFYIVMRLFLFIHCCVYPENVAGKVVIITGASSGIGEELAYEYARRGACLALAARREKSLRQVADKCLEYGAKDAITVTADVSKVDDCKRIVESTVSHFKTLNHVVCNAGITMFTMFGAYEDITQTRSVVDINFWGSVYITRFAIPYLRQSRGTIIVLSSLGSWLTLPRMSIYNASKAAMVAFFETLRVEFGSDIQITIATPGLVESEITKGKHISMEGHVKVDSDMRDVLEGTFPIGKTDECAKEILNGACRGQRYVNPPMWCRTFYFFKLTCSELLDWFIRALYITNAGDTPSKALTKRISDLTGLKAATYGPSSIPEVKSE